MNYNTSLAGRRARPGLASPAVLLILLLVCAGGAGKARAGAAAQDDEAGAAGRRPSSEVARMLSRRNPVERREAAEGLARERATEHQRLVEGYRVQEKDSRVRLALDWALYRMGRPQALYPVVRELDTSRAEQALGYLKELDAPDPLYVFLPRVNGNTQVRLLEALAHLGDAGTLEQIKPLAASLDPRIADAALFAEREINIRLAESPRDTPRRPRRTGSASEEETP